jgi:hypothetical protein
VQAAHAPPVQIGIAAGQVALVRHCTHLLVARSQSGVAPEQLELSAHCTHAPLAAQAARAGSPSVAHWAEVVHWAHLPVAEQIGADAGQVVFVEHCGVGTSGLPSAVPVSIGLMGLSIGGGPPSEDTWQPG